jgi:glycosyltransferase involved in cell wall biosynthesis
LTVEVSARLRTRIAYIVRSWPRLSQTFVLNEILQLQRHGYEIEIFGMTPSGESLVQEGVGEIKGPVRFLDEALKAPLVSLVSDHATIFAGHPIRYLSTIAFLLRRADLTAGYTTTTRRAGFLQSVYLAARLGERRRAGEPVAHVHSHFAHDPTLIALLVKKLTGISYSFTAHARDMLQIPATSLAERIRHASAVVSICRANVDYLKQIAPETSGDKFRVVHTGIDLDAFVPAKERRTSAGVPLIVAVGRLVEKKGLLDLVAALERVRAGGRGFRCAIYGEGPLRGELERAIATRSLGDCTELAGAHTQASLRDVLPGADVFALTPFVTRDGDSAGLPCVILEAMACGLPVVSTRVAGIPEAVVHGVTGLLAEPRDIAAIAAHLETLLDDEALRKRLGANGRAAVVRQWSAGTAADQLAAVFVGASGSTP